jgi:hypothetical protein
MYYITSHSLTLKCARSNEAPVSLKPATYLPHWFQLMKNNLYTALRSKLQVRTWLHRKLRETKKIVPVVVQAGHSPASKA